MRLFTKIVVGLSLVYCTCVLIAMKLKRLELREEFIPRGISSPVFLLRPPYGGFLVILFVVFAAWVRYSAERSSPEHFLVAGV